MQEKKFGPNGEGYIWTPILNGHNRDIPFLVNGEQKWGHVAKLSTLECDKVEVNKKKGIRFVVDYITDSGCQGATIPYSEENFKLFRQIIKDKVFFVFRTVRGYNRDMINGIGVTNYKDHRKKDYDDKWLFWEVDEI